ncbi:hypothetical protein GOODEAATRI_013752 [Goodea atripinnis]|uniref:Uncharacterized protein n=1 Tax=Goodea atripinnis TaxID=208336 RepID=A0ABV0PDU9_9TELE
MEYSPKCATNKLIYKGSLSITLEMVKRSRTHRRENTDSEIALQLLKSVPDTVWSSRPFNVGLCSEVPPILLQMKSADVINQPHYPLSPEKLEGRRGTIYGLLS